MLIFDVFFIGGIVLVRVSEDFEDFMVDLLLIFMNLPDIVSCFKIITLFRQFLKCINLLIINFLILKNITVLSCFYHTFITLRQAQCRLCVFNNILFFIFD